MCIAVAGSSCHESEEHHAETYLNEWAVEIHGGEKRARAVAEETGFVYMSRVSHKWDKFITEMESRPINIPRAFIVSVILSVCVRDQQDPPVED